MTYMVDTAAVRAHVDKYGLENLDGRTKQILEERVLKDIKGHLDLLETLEKAKDEDAPGLAQELEDARQLVAKLAG